MLEKKISRKNPEGKGKSYKEASCAGECDPEILGYGLWAEPGLLPPDGGKCLLGT